MKQLQGFIIGLITFVALSATASNCYICGSGSSEYCKNYCQFPGKDTQANRKKCTEAGCKIGGTATCPTAVNYKVCTVGSVDRSIDAVAKH